MDNDPAMTPMQKANDIVSVVACPQCNSTYPVAGRHFMTHVCKRCGEMIPPAEEHPWVRENREKKDRFVRKYIWPILAKAGRRKETDADQ